MVTSVTPAVSLQAIHSIDAAKPIWSFPALAVFLLNSSFINNVYVTDTTSVSNQIQKFTTNGTFITSWGAVGSGDGQFEEPTSIALDSSDNVYVIDRGNMRIQVFVPS
jgi:hypothetical protein